MVTLVGGQMSVVVPQFFQVIEALAAATHIRAKITHFILR